MPSVNMRRLNAFLYELIRHPERYGVTIEEAAKMQLDVSDAVFRLNAKF